MKLILRFIALKMSILRVDAAIIKRKKVKRNGWAMPLPLSRPKPLQITTDIQGYHRLSKENSQANRLFHLPPELSQPF